MIEIALRCRPLGRAAIVAMLRVPQSRLRREIGEWGMREVGVGSVARQDFEVIRTFASDEFEVEPAPELASILGYDTAPLVGVEAGIRFLRDWFDAWDAFEFVPREGVDLGDGRVLLLNHVRGLGLGSGVEVIAQEEAELWEARGGLVTRVVQWWRWCDALEATGLPVRARWSAGPASG
jgi:hypothetical protein